MVEPSASQASDQESVLIGRVLQVNAGSTFVEVGGQRLQCSLRGALKKERMETLNPVAVGDYVEVEPQADGFGQVLALKERRNKLSRPAQGQERIEQVLVSNMDALGIVASLAQPRFKPQAADRFMVAAWHGKMQPFLVLTKKDLVSDDETEQALNYYQDLDCPIFIISNLTGDGLPALKDHIKEKDIALCGQSGVGKSSLVNVLCDEAPAITGELNVKTGKGTHTTTNIVMHRHNGNGALVDMPGNRSFNFWRLESSWVDAFFEEMVELSADCRFPTCSHDHEPECAIKQAVEDQKVPLGRYRAYLRIKESLDDLPEQYKPRSGRAPLKRGERGQPPLSEFEDDG